MKKLLWMFLAFSLLLPQAARANQAVIMMIPDRVVMEGNARYSTLIVKNIGNATGDFDLELVDMKMLENGRVVPLDQGETAQYSATPYVHISPRSMTLKPGATQNVRMILHRPENMEAGEYRTHLKVRLVNDNAGAAVNPTGKDTAIFVQARLAIVISIIVRTGATSLSIGIDAPKIARDANGNPSIEMYLTRTGNQSSMGDITVTWYPQSGAPKVIKVYQGVAVYRPTARRFISVPLDETPKGISLSHGKLGIVYFAQEKEGGKKLAETQLNLP